MSIIESLELQFKEWNRPIDWALVKSIITKVINEKCETAIRGRIQDMSVANLCEFYIKVDKKMTTTPELKTELKRPVGRPAHARPN